MNRGIGRVFIFGTVSHKRLRLCNPNPLDCRVEPSSSPPSCFIFSSIGARPSSLSLGICSPALFARKEKERRRFVPIRCVSILQIHSYETMDFERRPELKWCLFFRRIATMENEGHRSSAMLDRWEEEERCLSKWELCRIAKELRKFRHFRLTFDKDPIAMDEGSKMGRRWQRRG